MVAADDKSTIHTTVTVDLNSPASVNPSVQPSHLGALRYQTPIRTFDYRGLSHAPRRGGALFSEPVTVGRKIPIGRSYGFEMHIGESGFPAISAQIWPPSTPPLIVAHGKSTALQNYLAAAEALFYEKSEQIARERLDSLVAIYAEETPIPRYSPKLVKMIANAQAEVFKATQWLTSTELSKYADLKSKNLSAGPAKWKAEKKIFSVKHKGSEWFPIYAIDTHNNFRPVKGLQPILKAFDDTKDSWGLAYWFAGVNSFLGGERPQDVLQNDPVKVLAAAKDEMAGIQHG